MESDIQPKWKYPGNPSPRRGIPMHLGSNISKQMFAYGSQENAILRDIDNLINGYKSFEGHSKAVTTVQCSPTNDKVASADEIGYAHIWNADHPTLMSSWEIQAINGIVHDSAFNEEGDRVAFVGEVVGGKCGRAVNINMKKTDQELIGHVGRVLSCSYKPKRPYILYTGAEDSLVNILPVPSYNLTKSLKNHKGFVNCVRASPDANWLATCSADKSIIIFKIETEAPHKVIENAHNGSVYSLCWFEDSKTLASCGADKLVKIWSCDGDLLSTLHISSTPTVDDMQMGVVKVKGHLISLSLSGNLNLWSEKSIQAEKVDHPERIIYGHNVDFVYLETYCYNKKDWFPDYFC